MTVTRDLIRRAPKFLSIKQEISGEKYLMFDDGGVPVETGEFLYGLIRLIKPQACLTTGTYSGISDMYVADALRENGFGHCTSVEYEPLHMQRATELWKTLGVDPFVNCVLQSSLDFEPERIPSFPGKFDMIFLDTEPNIRFQELVKFFPYLKAGGFIFIHDCPITFTQGNINTDHPEIESWPFGNLPKQIKDWVKDGDLRPFHLPDPRGLACFYKPLASEYKWL